MESYPEVKCFNCEQKGGVVKTGTNWFNCVACHIGFYLDEATIDPIIKGERGYDKFLASGGDVEKTEIGG